MLDLSFIATETLAQFSLFLPRIVGSFLILIIGAAVARALRRVVIKILETLKVSNVVKNTPVEHFLKGAELKKIEEVIGSIVYWLIILVVLHTTVAVLGLEPLTLVLDRVLQYIPSVFSAMIILFIGVLLAGVTESVIKGSIKSIDGKSSRLLGKVASYLVITIAILASVSELGIASEFILILFIGLITMLALGFGLALGLGGQDIVRQMLQSWYDKISEEVRE